MTARPLITVAQRRARLQRRHLLDGGAGRRPADVADAVVALHATVPSTVHLSVWARGGAVDPGVVETALYDDRSLVKQLVMRRTLFVMTRPVLADAVGAVGPRVAASERTNMLRDLRREDGPPDPEAWLADARRAVLAEFAGGAAFPAPELRTRLPEFDLEIMRDADKSYGGPSPMLPRLLNLMAASGDVVRGPNGADWHRSRPSWTAMQTWLGAPLPAVDQAAGHAAMVERWLRRYGPGSETDLVWWLGTTKTAVRAALATLDVTEVDMEAAGTGYLMSDDLADLEPVTPRALLLPSLDPTTMGWKDRDFYLGGHAAELFDRNGNGGQTAWWDGRVVGGWVLADGADGGRAVRVVPLEDLPPEALRALDRRAEELSEWLGESRPTPGFPSPLMTRHR
ncbi:MULTISPECIES: winged helix DNA-binding domain-containing protein [Gordonia]|uniref:winged helix DNA-binding domain-containing protein n=1 Tax=Gordonia TaxID=2053 RepID=UPI003266165B